MTTIWIHQFSSNLKLFGDKPVDSIGKWVSNVGWLIWIFCFNICYIFTCFHQNTFHSNVHCTKYIVIDILLPQSNRINSMKIEIINLNKTKNGNGNNRHFECIATGIRYLSFVNSYVLVFRKRLRTHSITVHTPDILFIFLCKLSYKKICKMFIHLAVCFFYKLYGLKHIV